MKFYKKTFVKIILVLALLAGSLFVVRYFFNNNSKVSGAQNSGSSLESYVTRNFQSMTIQKQGIPANISDVYFMKFKEYRDYLNDILQKSDLTKRGDQIKMYDLMIRFGNLYKDVGDYERSEKAFLYAIELTPDSYVAAGNLGALYYLYMDKPQEAEKYYLIAIERDNPVLETYYQELFDLYREKLHDPQKGEAALKQAIDKYPKATDIVGLLAFYYEESGRIDEARTMYQLLLQRYPESIVAKQGLQRLKTQ